MRYSLFSLILGFFLSGAVFANSETVPSTEEIKHRLQELGSDHPRILASKSDFVELLRSIPASVTRSKIHYDILKECEKILSLPKQERIQTGRRLLGVSRESLRRIFYLSYAYNTVGDERFLQRAEEEIITVCQFSDWNPSHFLDVGEMTMAVAIGYDWLFDKLKMETKALAQEAIVVKGLMPSYDSKYNWFVKGTNNWNQVCHAGMVFGALAIAESHPELSAKVVQRAIEFVPRSMQFYAPDGAYPEGYMYWDYGTSFNVLLIDALDKVFGKDFGLSSQQGFMESADYIQHMVGPTMLPHNWGDASTNSFLLPAVYWFAGKARNPSALWLQKKTIVDSKEVFTRNRILPALLLWSRGMDVDNIPEPTQLTWKGQGKSPVGLMRTSWSDPNAFFVGFKAGSASVSHAHMDVGSFVIDAKGERWAMDFGMQNYHSLESAGVNLWSMAQDSERWKVFRYNNLVHNTLTVNDQLHNVKGYAKIERSSDNPSDLYFTTDMSELFTPHITRSERGVRLLEGNRVVIRDEIKTSDSGAKVRWSFLTSAEVEILKKDLVALTKNGKTMYLRFKGSAKLNLKTWSTKSPNPVDADNGNTVVVGFEANLPGGNSDEYFEVVFSDSKKTKGPGTRIREWP